MKSYCDEIALSRSFGSVCIWKALPREQKISYLVERHRYPMLYQNMYFTRAADSPYKSDTAT